MKRVASIATHVLSPSRASAEVAVGVEDQDAHLGSCEQPGSWPIFDAATPIDDAFVQRFLTEGFLTMAPDIPPATIEQIDARLKELTPPVVA
eukprot:COSAG05_NODE_12081_length_484_cov_0.825974_1_plen_91_part_10